MNEGKWKDVSLQIKPHLEAIREIAEENEIGCLCMSVYTPDHYYSAFTIDENTKEHFSISDYTNKQNGGNTDEEN